MNTKLSKWIKWLKQIETEIYNLVLYKDVFWSVQNLIKETDEIQKPSVFYKYLGDTFVSHALIGIRRQIKIDRDSISFRRLLSEIIEAPETLSRDYFVSLYNGSFLEKLGQGDKDFNKYCGNTPNHISKEMVIADNEKLSEKANKCESFADRVIAHTDKRDPKYPLTCEDVNSCIDFLDQLCCKYNLIFHATYTESLKPVYQYDWQEIFDAPWRKINN